MRYDDEPDEDDDWDDAPDEATVPCPFCGHEIYDDTPRCPSCERFLSPDDFQPTRRPLWVTVTAIVCLLVAIWLALATF